MSFPNLPTKVASNTAKLRKREHRKTCEKALPQDCTLSLNSQSILLDQNSSSVSLLAEMLSATKQLFIILAYLY